MRQLSRLDWIDQMKRYKPFYGILLTLAMTASVFFASPSRGYAQTSQDWSDPVNLSNSGASTNPSIVVDAKGTIHVIWFDQLDGYKYSESLDGVVWSHPKTVEFPFSPLGDTRPTFVPNDDGEIHILWRNQDSQTLYYSKSLSSNLDEPSAWTNSTELAEAVVNFNVKVNSNGNLYVGYISSKGTETIPPGVNFRRLNGAGWSQPKNLYSSQYFRSLTSEDSNIQLGVSEGGTTDNVFIVWDDRPQKRIFLARSSNNGDEWEDSVQISGPDDYIGLTLPFNINIGFFDNEPLLVWWVGSSGGRCSLYSQLYVNDANQLDTSGKLREEFSFCPQTSEFIVQYGDYPLLLLSAQDDVSLIAWNGSNWSAIQNQEELSVFENPATLDGVLFGCKKVAVYKEKIYSIGCDKGIGRDIWFRSRELGSLDTWFPSPSAWKTPTHITSVNQRISMLSSEDDENNNIHIFWIQSSFLDEAGDETLQYAKWGDGVWSKPVAILAEFKGKPIQFTVTADLPGRLLLSWIDGDTGEVLFSWANSDRAVSPSEWDTPVYIRSVSPINSSPNLLADSSGRIIITFAVPVNEHRGIYFVSSDDTGRTWSEPLLLFDAAAAGWDLVDQPKLGLSGDGRLHVLFERFSLKGGHRQSEGLYYSQSSNGGDTWSDAELVSEGSVSWSDIVAYDQQIVHRLWQEKDGTKLVNFHQFSENGGLTWSTPISIAGVINGAGSPSVNVEWNGNLHLMQLVQNDGVFISHQEWNGSQWSRQEPYELSIKGSDASYLLTSSIASDGYLLALSLMSHDDLVNGQMSDLLSVGRFLDVLPSADSTPSPALIATQRPRPASGTNHDASTTPTQISPLTNLYDPSTSLSKSRNLIGILFLVGVLILTFVILRPKPRNK